VTCAHCGAVLAPRRLVTLCHWFAALLDDRDQLREQGGRPAELHEVEEQIAIALSALVKAAT
jgi:hypothetical protein